MTTGGTILNTAVPKSRLGSGYLPQLDGLRAIGIALVLVHHGLQPLEFGGFLGVDVFFVLSGFLITGILLREWRTQGKIRIGKFYLRRAIRLYPSLLLALAVILPFGFALWGTKHFVEVALAVTYLTPLVVEVLGKGSQIWLHTWSLGIEEMFYLVWPVALIGALRWVGSKAWILIGVLGLAMMIVQIQLFSATGETSFFLRAGGILMGCSLALWLERRPVFCAAAPVGQIGLIGLVGAVVIGSVEGLQAVAFALAASATVALLASISTRQSALVSALSSPAVVYIGKISYELYIWHYAILVVLRLATDSRLIDVALVGIPLSVVLAVGTHRLLAKRIDRWKKQFAQ
ncbi:acyltransferase [Arthrobacter sp. Cr_A7]|uniref:acyltransferase family protein n=1 Tax=Arthrobacter sp. Cr_A7 TaxID=3031017 RepID=UPI0023DA7862|nr:acyltransferase [Arthrobacter sp. Cr_A7]MDF2048418.1 acyltransferase [Arthrobacter sp. Cr_A7]